MFRFVKQIFLLAMFFYCNDVNSLNTVAKCISMNNQECKIRPEIININSNEVLFYPYRINDPYSKLCVPDVVKNMNIKVFHLMPRTNETRHIKWHETCKCKCRLDASVCNNKHRCNNGKCRCERKELIDKGICDKRFI